jgi:hypothetical protein
MGVIMPKKKELYWQTVQVLLPYKMRLWIVISYPGQRDATMRMTNELVQHEISGNHAASTIKSGDLAMVFFDMDLLKTPISFLEAACHEAVHVTHACMEYAGIKADIENDEPEAYLTSMAFAFMAEAYTEATGNQALAAI